MPRSQCPPGVICMSNNLIIAFLVLAIIGIVFLFVMRNQPANELLKALHLSTRNLMQQQQMPPQPPTIVNVRGGDDRYTQAPLPLRDWMAPPEFGPPPPMGAMPVNIPTRGIPESFQPVGMINSDGKMLPLYGRRTTGSSDRWNYYTRTDTYNPIPVPLVSQRRDCMDDVGCNELMSGDNVHMEGTGQNGKVTLYKFGGPRYIPGLL